MIPSQYVARGPKLDFNWEDIRALRARCELRECDQPVGSFTTNQYMEKFKMRRSKACRELRSMLLKGLLGVTKVCQGRRRTNYYWPRKG